MIEGSSPGLIPGEPRILRVAELVADLRLLLQDAVGRVWVVGEISNLRRPLSGHCYFTLKDDEAQLRAALFRRDAARLRFEPEDGLEVLAYVELSVYEARGDLQLIVRQLEPRGQGALQLAIEQLRVRLERQGLFAPERKRALPPRPRSVGVVTSLAGAALRDVMEVSGNRAPGVPLLIAPARVQGEGAEHEVVGALERLADSGEVDVILVVRGGGSLEDLLPFNTELVARAVADCPVPVVSGVGHETDVTLADLAADVRAPTPSAAAARILPDDSALLDRLGRDRRRLEASSLRRIGGARARLEVAAEALRHLSPRVRITARQERLAHSEHRLATAIGLQLEGGRRRVAVAAGRLDTLSPLAVLGRGYAIARRREDGRIVRRPRDVTPGDRLDIRVAAGEIEAQVIGSPEGDEVRGVLGET